MGFLEIEDPELRKVVYQEMVDIRTSGVVLVFAIGLIIGFLAGIIVGGIFHV